MKKSGRHAPMNNKNKKLKKKSGMPAICKQQTRNLRKRAACPLYVHRNQQIEEQQRHARYMCTKTGNFRK